jgi:hypothetical protein
VGSKVGLGFVSRPSCNSKREQAQLYVALLIEAQGGVYDERSGSQC